MGKATRWFKGLLGMKKEKENIDSSNVAPINQKEKKRWSFGKSGKATNAVSNVPINNLSPDMPTVDTAWLRSYLTESDKAQNKHAIAIAAATAAAAEVAVAAATAAQAAVAVVRLTSQGKGDGMLYGNRDKWAVVKIQNVFRGYLARKALRALKGLVKLQALVRGYLVRKRAAATLHSMQALIRAQAAARFQRAHRSFKKDNCLYPEFHARKSIERLDETRSEYHSKRLSATYEAFEESPKIVEIDTFKQRTRSRRFSTALSECSEDMPYHTISSPLPCPGPGPGQISIQDCRHIQDFEWYFDAQETKFTTAQNTPKFGSSFWSNIPATPAKSVCGDSSFYRPYSNFPNYMANTKSFKAKLRSQSAPKQRPEPAGSKKRLSLDEIMAARNSVSSVRMQRVCPQVIEEVYHY